MYCDASFLKLPGKIVEGQKPKFFASFHAAPKPVPSFHKRKECCKSKIILTISVYCCASTQEFGEGQAVNGETSASGGLQDANPTIRPYTTALPPILTAHQAKAPNSNCPTAISI